MERDQERRLDPKVLEQIKQRIEGLDYGEVTVVVHQQKVSEVKTTRRERT